MKPISSPTIPSPEFYRIKTDFVEFVFNFFRDGVSDNVNTRTFKLRFFSGGIMVLQKDPTTNSAGRITFALSAENKSLIKDNAQVILVEAKADLTEKTLVIGELIWGIKDKKNVGLQDPAEISINYKTATQELLVSLGIVDLGSSSAASSAAVAAEHVQAVLAAKNDVNQKFNAIETTHVQIVQNLASSNNILQQNQAILTETTTLKVAAENAVANAALGQDPLGEYNAASNTPALTGTPGAGFVIGAFYTVTVSGNAAFTGSNFASGAALAVGGRLIKKSSTQWYYAPPSDLALVKVLNLESNVGGEVVKGDVKLVSGDKVARKAVLREYLLDNINLYDYTEDIEGYYIHIPTGTLSHHSTSAISSVIDVTNYEKVVIYNRTGNAGARFLSASGVPMKPLLANGIEAANYDGPLNGEYYKPVGAVGFQFTTKFTGTTNRQNTTVRAINNPQEYIKPDLVHIPRGKIAEGDTGLISGEEAAKKTVLREYLLDNINLYNYTEDIEGYYIQSLAGGLTVSPTSAISKVIDVTNYEKVVISGRTGSGEIRFLSSGETSMKPLLANGTEAPSYAGALNGEFYKPAGAVGFQFTTKFTGTTNRQNITVRISSQTQEYIKPGLIIIPKGIISEGNTGLISGDEVAKKTILREYLLDNVNLYNYISDIEGFYIQSLAGGLTVSSTSAISSVIDVTNYEKVVIYNRTGNAGARFLSASGVPMKPLLANGIEAANYDGPLNGEYYKPVGAVGFQFTTKFTGTTNRQNTTVRINSQTREYIKPGLMPPPVEKRLNLIKTGTNYEVTGKNAAGRLIVTKFVTRINADGLSNPNFNLLDDRIDGVLLKAYGDDISPSYLNNSYVGGNHGWNQAKTLTLAGHGKTVADVGSIYTDSLGRDFVLVRIIDADNLIICGRNLASDGFSYSFPTPNGTLTYKSNGESTSTISGYSVASLSNLYNTVFLRKSAVLIDGKPVNLDGTWPCDKVCIVEDYDVLDLDSVLSELVAGRPVGGYLSHPNLNSLPAEKLFNHSLTYEWCDAGKCIVSHSFLTYRKLNFSFLSGLQCSAIVDSTARLYIPKTLPIGGTDYRLAPVYVTPGAPINFTSSFWESADSPPDRFLHYLPGGAGVHIGFIPDVGDMKNREDLVENALMLYTSKKIYPFAVHKPAVLESGSHYSFSIFRNIIDFSSSAGIRLSVDHVIANGSLYLYADYQGSGIDTISLPAEFLNREIVVLEAKDVQPLTRVSTGEIKIKSSVLPGGYGFIVLKI